MDGVPGAGTQVCPGRTLPPLTCYLMCILYLRSVTSSRCRDASPLLGVTSDRPSSRPTPKSTGSISCVRLRKAGAPRSHRCARLGTRLRAPALEQHYECAPPPAASQPSRKAARARLCASSRAICRGRTSRSTYGSTAAMSRRRTPALSRCWGAFRHTVYAGPSRSGPHASTRWSTTDSSPVPDRDDTLPGSSHHCRSGMFESYRATSHMERERTQRP